MSNTYTVEATNDGGDIRLGQGVSVQSGYSAPEMVVDGRDLRFLSGNVEVPYGQLDQLVTLPDNWKYGAGTSSCLCEATIVRGGQDIAQGLISLYIAGSPNASVSGYFNQPIIQPDGTPVTLAPDDVIRVYLNAGTSLRLPVEP